MRNYGGARNHAVDIFVHRLRSSIGAMLASLGGLDALVFTGIGENYATIRAAACEAFEFLGLRLDTEKKCLPVLKTSAWRIQRWGDSYSGGLGDRADG